MNKQVYSRTLMALIVMFALLLNVSPALADDRTPPPPPPDVQVDENLAESAQTAQAAAPARLAGKTLKPLVKALQRQNPVTAEGTSVSAYQAGMYDGSWKTKSGFATGETARYLGVVSNTTGVAQDFYAWWYDSSPCGSYWMWSGWLRAPTGNPGWYLESAASCPGTHNFTFWVYYNGNYTSQTTSFTVGNKACSVPTDQFCGEYYNNRTLSGSPVFTQNTSNASFDWGMGGPGNGVGNDNFSARWQGSFNFDNATYTFTTSDDDGVRLFVDGTLLVDAWKDQPITTFTKDIALTSGRHTIKIEYYENAGGALSKTSWQKKTVNTCSVPTGQFCGEYYNNRTLSGSPVFTQNTSTVNFNWGNGGPGNGVANDNFSARWQGTFSFENATYTFAMTGDDGVRLFVDNSLLIDGWKDQPVTSYAKDIALSSGNHTVRIEYYENAGDAVAQASWQKKSTSAIDVEGARAKLRSMSQMKSPWTQVDAPLKNNTSSRSSDWYAALIDQFDVTSSSFSGRYAANGAGLSDTRCNIFAGDVMRAMGAPLPRKGDVGHGASGSTWTDPMTANATDQYNFLNGNLRSNDPANSGWVRVDATTSQGLAQLIAHVNAGKPALASTSGHIAVIRPGQSTSLTNWRDLRIAQAGASLFSNGALSSGFGSLVPQFFIHQ